MPWPVLKYQYRKIFHLSYEEFMLEPIDELFTNITIWSLIEKKRELDIKHGSK